jgi:hypothetical protein
MADKSRSKSHEYSGSAPVKKIRTKVGVVNPIKLKKKKRPTMIRGKIPEEPIKPSFDPRRKAKWSDYLTPKK